MPNPVQRARGQGVPRPEPLLAPNWFLGLVPRQYWNARMLPFTYQADFANAVGNSPQGNGGPAVAANGTSQFTLPIQADSHFLAVYVAALVTTTDNLTLVYGNGATGPSTKLITLVDAGPNQPLSNVAVPLDNLFGTGQNQAALGLPKIFRASGGIGIVVQNLNTTTAHHVRLSFIGIRIYVEQAA